MAPANHPFTPASIVFLRQHTIVWLLAALVTSAFTLKCPIPVVTSLVTTDSDVISLLHPGGWEIAVVRISFDSSLKLSRRRSSSRLQYLSVTLVHTHLSQECVCHSPCGHSTAPPLLEAVFVASSLRKTRTFSIVPSCIAFKLVAHYETIVKTNGARYSNCSPDRLHFCASSDPL